MVEVLLFHHAQGLTPGVLAFAEALRSGGHVVHAPDLYEGRTFSDLDEGVAHAEQLGFGTIVARGEAAAEDLPADIVYAGFSLGVMPAQMLTQTRHGARGALFFHSCVPPAEFGGTWPAGVPMQIHTMENDGWGDVEIAQEVARENSNVDLFLYPGDQHLFTDNSLPAYDEAASALAQQRALAMLGSI
jgi:dienelactone hydrolase